MASANKIYRGLGILIPKFDDPAGYHLSAEHDELHVHPTNNPVTPEEFSELKALGWFQSESEDENAYDPKLGWMIYV